MAGGSVAVDTSVVIAVLRADNRVISAFDDCERVLVPFVVRGELLYGAMRSKKKDKNIGELEPFFTRYAAIESSDAVTGKYAEIKTDLASRGRMIPDNDIWIAACALAESVPLASRDRHFSSVEGLEVLDW
jgi:tRNA(fMet)-specific endonuclease VapC